MSKQGPFLTIDQANEIRKEMVDAKDATPVRFTYQGQAYDSICTGALMSKGVNVMYQTVYWHFTKETSNKIAGWLGANVNFG